MAGTSRSFVVPSPVLVAPPPRPPVNDEVQKVLLRFASLSVRARQQGDPELATWIDQAGLRAAAARLRM
ncbi:hypothetical protein [Methylobacterium nodulans]|uniref:Uncharacterized protein n=1 Tax=Methylobacterium nodulans (strain LMG 21967 / CNCM I-2342 / ORS 2060) TaxID=460265 RepID=B8IV98_METNO|nr:hypothetical protein [Methylobacterium nodulans]ACL60949.1 conserved hypothetical protein [Methylobacterium nodulans ORS 2060]